MKGTEFEVVDTPTLDQEELREVFHDHLEKANEEHNDEFLQKTHASLTSDIQSLVANTQMAKQQLGLVTQFLPFFDRNYLISEGATDMLRLDETYLVKIGQSLIRDYRSFEASAKELMQMVVDIQNEVTAIDVQQLNDQILSNVGAKATHAHTQLMEWSGAYERVIGEAMSDIANHLNPLRPSDRQIKL